MKAKIGLLLFASLGLTACFKTQKQQETVSVADQQVPQFQQEVRIIQPTRQQQELLVRRANGDYYQDPEYGKNVVAGINSPLKDRVIYFNFDSYQISNDSQKVLLAQANYLRNNPSVRVVLEGHTDERGSRAYNLGLGEKRAIAVKNALINAGVNEEQIETLSYGEERPAAWGSDPDSYARNRRVVLSY